MNTVGLFSVCSFELLTKDILDECNRFSCGDDDMDEFFYNDALDYTQFRMGKTYCFRLISDLKSSLHALLFQMTALESSILVVPERTVYGRIFLIGRNDLAVIPVCLLEGWLFQKSLQVKVMVPMLSGLSKSGLLMMTISRAVVLL